MSKRIGEARSGVLKRARESDGDENIGRYTQGPLDEAFGSHPVLPVEGDSEVTNYLKQVRQQALSDDTVVFARRDRNTPKEVLTKDVPETNEKFRIWAQMVMDRFMAQKTEMKQTHASRTYTYPDTSAEWRALIMGSEPPEHGYFTALTHSSVVKLIVYATKWLSAKTSPNLSLWLFTLLVRLDTPLDYSETAVLREAAKKAIRIYTRANLQLDPTTKYTFGYLVAIIGTYYGQQDLLREVDAIDL